MPPTLPLLLPSKSACITQDSPFLRVDTLQVGSSELNCKPKPQFHNTRAPTSTLIFLGVPIWGPRPSAFAPKQVSPLVASSKKRANSNRSRRCAEWGVNPAQTFIYRTRHRPEALELFALSRARRGTELPQRTSHGASDRGAPVWPLLPESLHFGCKTCICGGSSARRQRRLLGGRRRSELRG